MVSNDTVVSVSSLWRAYVDFGFLAGTIFYTGTYEPSFEHTIFFFTFKLIITFILRLSNTLHGSNIEFDSIQIKSARSPLPILATALLVTTARQVDH